MFERIIKANATLYAFLSGLMISVATSAAGLVAFSPSSNGFHGSVYYVGVVAFSAGILWFIISERVSSHKVKLETLSVTLGNKKAAIDSFPKSEKRVTNILAFFAILLSCLWPFIRTILTKLSVICV